VEVTKGFDNLDPANLAEKEILEVFAPDNSLARLACQLTISSDVEFKSIGK
jgi:ferredoxin